MLEVLRQKFFGPLTRALRRGVVAIVFALLALVLLTAAVVFGGLAGYDKLSETRPDWMAAAIVAGAFLAVAIILLTMGALLLRQPAPAKGTADKPLSETLASSLEQAPRNIAVELAALGLPMVVPLGRQARERIDRQPFSTAFLALVGGFVTGFILLARQPRAPAPPAPKPEKRWSRR